VYIYLPQFFSENGGYFSVFYTIIIFMNIQENERKTIIAYTHFIKDEVKFIYMYCLIDIKLKVYFQKISYLFLLFLQKR